MAAWYFACNVAWGHCDTLGGPVVTDARVALEKGDVRPVLKWVKKEDEGEVRTAFEKALVVRAKGPEAKELADLYFFETVVRLHRASEGEPYTGLKPAGAVEPPVAASDKALDTGNVEALVKQTTETVADGIRKRFARVVEARKHKDENVAAGRTFVGAYVEFVHYVERIFIEAESGPHHRGAEAGDEPHHAQ